LHACPTGNNLLQMKAEIRSEGKHLLDEIRLRLEAPRDSYS